MQTNHLLTYRNFIILFALFLSFGLLSACGADDSDDEADNDDSETLTLYNGQHKDATTALIDAFEDKTDIEVEERDGSSNELAHQITEEGDQSPADLIYTEESSPLIMLTEEGLLSKIDEDALESIPSEYRDSKNNWTGILARSRVVAYNQEMIKEDDLPDSVLDFAKPEWDGKFAFVPTSGAFQMQLSALIKLEGKETAKEWLEGLKEHGKIYKDNVAALEAVENGEIELGLINNYYWDRKAKEEGEENLDSRLYFFGTHDIGDMLTVASMGVLESSSHKEEAQQFIEFAASEEGQQILTDESSQYPLNDEADTEGLKPFSELTPPEGTLDLGEYSNGDEAEQLLQDVGLL